MPAKREARSEPTNARAPGSRGRDLPPFPRLPFSCPCSAHPAALLALLLLAPGLLLPGCAPPNPTAAAGAAPAATPPAFPFGHRVDSLNGIAGHRFGEPPGAFPRLHLELPTTGMPTRTYTSEATTGWFGQHRAQVPDQY